MQKVIIVLTKVKTVILCFPPNANAYTRLPLFTLYGYRLRSHLLLATLRAIRHVRYRLAPTPAPGSTLAHSKTDRRPLDCTYQYGVLFSTARLRRVAAVLIFIVISTKSMYPVPS